MLRHFFADDYAATLCFGESHRVLLSRHLFLHMPSSPADIFGRLSADRSLFSLINIFIYYFDDYVFITFFLSTLRRFFR